MCMTATKQVPVLSNSYSANTVKYCTVRGLTGQPSTVSTDTMTLTVTACALPGTVRCALAVAQLGWRLQGIRWAMTDVP